MNDKPVVSIITASYNHAAFIGEAVESVRGQDYDSWELLIADDASTDATLEALASYKDDSRIKVFPFEINRQHHMRNFAAEHACGDYIAFLNSDDVFLAAKLRRQVQYMQAHSEAAGVFTHVEAIDEGGGRLACCELETLFAVENRTRHQWLRYFFSFGNCLCISSALIRRSCFEQVGRFDPMLIQVADMDLWVKLCLRWDIHVIQERLTGMRLLSKGRNLSSPNTASNSRLLLEYPRVYGHYFCNEAIEQASEIFEGLAELVPEDTPAWRRYLISQMAVFAPDRAMRLAGCQNLHKLLECEDSKRALLRFNSRLLRKLFLSEGTAGLVSDHGGIMWRIWPVSENGGHPESALSYWTTAAGTGVICLSFPNPRKAGGLCICMQRDLAQAACIGFRLYSQASGDLVFESVAVRSGGRLAARGESVEVTRFNRMSKKWGTSPYFYFPEIDFAGIDSKWIDVEIEYCPSASYWLLRRVRKILGGRCMQVAARLLPQ